MGKNIFKKIQQKRHTRDKYKNPYFRRRNQKRWYPWIVGVACLILIVIAVLFFLRSDRFVIRSVEINGVETIDPEKIERIVDDHLNKNHWFFFLNNNRFLFNADDLKKTLHANYAFKELNIRLNDRQLLIDLVEKTSELVWYTQGEPYLVDLQGNVIRRLNEEEITFLEQKNNSENQQAERDESSTGMEMKHIQSLPVFVDVNDASVEPGDSVLTQEEVQNIFTFQDHLEAQEVEYTEVQIDRLAGQWVSVLTTVGYRILFNPTGDIDQQAINLQTILRESVENQDELQYIDLRFGDHVYIK